MSRPPLYVAIVAGVVTAGMLGIAGYLLFPAATAHRTAPDSAGSDGQKPTIAVIGDSYTSGFSGFGDGDSGWPALLAEKYGLALVLDAQPGTGYRATIDPGTRTFPQRAGEAVDDATDYVIIAGSRNDVNAQPEAVRQAAVKTIGLIAAEAPHAQIIVIGPMWAGDEAAHAARVEQAVDAAATTSGVTFVDGSDWLPADHVYLAEDHIHPNDAGHKLLFKKIDDAVGSLLTRN